jgi:hypothetical protein
VNQAKDVIENLGVVGVLFEPHQLIIDRIEAFAGFGQELPQQIVHETGLRTHGRTTASHFGAWPASMQSV